MAANKIYKIGPSLVVDGEKEFKAAIADVNKSLSVLASEAKKTAAAYADDKESLEALVVQTENYQNQAEMQRKKVNVLTEAYEQSKEQLGENAAATKDWLIKLNNAEAALIKTESAIEDNNKKINEQKTVINQVKAKYEEWQDKIEDIKNAHPGMTKALDVAGDAAKKLGNAGLAAIKVGATATVTGVTAVTSASVEMGKAIYDAASQAAAAGDEIDEASQRMNLSAEKFQEMRYAAKMSGVELQTLETAAKTLNKTAPDMDLSEAVNQIASIKDESKRTEKAIELFGSKAAYQMGPMLAQGAEGVEELKNQAHELGLVMSDEAVASSAIFNDSFDNMTSTMGAFKNNIGSDFLPGLTDMMNGVTTFFSNGEESLNNSKELISSGLMSIVESADTATVELLGKLEGASEIIGELAPEIIPFVVDTITASAPQLLESAEHILVTFAEGLLTEENMEKLSGVTVTLVSDVVGFVGDNSDMMMDGATTLILSLVDSLLMPENSKKLITGSLDVVTAIASGLISNSPEMIAGAIELIGVLIDEIIHYDWWGVAKDIYEGIKSGFKNIFSEEPDGSHAGGIDYVPYDGYRAMMHRGEQLLTASEAVVYRQDRAENFSDYAELNRKVDALIAAQNQPVNWTMTANGSLGALVRVLSPAIARENKRKSAFA